jgi:uncharacterized protein YxeA
MTFVRPSSAKSSGNSRQKSLNLLAINSSGDEKEVKIGADQNLKSNRQKLTLLFLKIFWGSNDDISVDVN